MIQPLPRLLSLLRVEQEVQIQLVVLGQPQVALAILFMLVVMVRPLMARHLQVVAAVVLGQQELVVLPQQQQGGLAHH
jgi:hypothetical protein